MTRSNWCLLLMADLAVIFTGCGYESLDDYYCDLGIEEYCENPSPTPGASGDYPPPANIVRHMDISYASGLRYGSDGGTWLDGSVVWHGIQSDGTDPFEESGMLFLDARDYDPESIWVILSENDGTGAEINTPLAWPYDGYRLLIDIEAWRAMFLGRYGRMPTSAKLMVSFAITVKHGYFPQDYSGYGYSIHEQGGSTVTWSYNAGALFPAWPGPNVGITWEVGNMPQFPGEITVYAESIDVPAAQYMFAWTHAPYVVEDISPDTRVYYYPGDDRIPTISQHAQGYLDMAVSFMGDPPYGPDMEGYTYGVAQVEWDGGGGMEHQWDVHIDGDSGTAKTVAHELCHAWYSTSIRYAFAEDIALSEGVCQWMGYELLGLVDGPAAEEEQWRINNLYLDYYLDGHESEISWPPTSGVVQFETMFNETAVYQRGAEMFRNYAYAIGGNDGHYRLFALLGEYYAINAGTAQYFGSLVEFLGERTGIDCMKYAERALRYLDDPREDLATMAEEDYQAQQADQLRCDFDPTFESKKCW